MSSGPPRQAARAGRLRPPHARLSPVSRAAGRTRPRPSSCWRAKCGARCARAAPWRGPLACGIGPRCGRGGPAVLLAADDDDHDDAEDALAVDLRALVERGGSSGAFLEVLRLRGPNVLEHLVLPPTGAACVAGVDVRGVCAGLALIDGRALREGERVTVPIAEGELWVRFAPAPRRLLPAEASRVAVVLLLMVACLASLTGNAARGADAACATGGAAVAGASEGASARSARRTRRRALAFRVRCHRRPRARARRPHSARASRPARRCGPRKTAPKPDGGDGPDDDDEPGGRAHPIARARGPPARTAGDRSRPIRSRQRRNPCSCCRSS